MPDYDYIYNHQADLYEQLVAREDVQGNILHVFESIAPLAGLDVVESGAGTGRLTGLLAPRVRSLRAFDLSTHMLERAAAKFPGLACEMADHRSLPVPDASADWVVAGWSLCYLALSTGESWKDELEKGLREFERVLRPGGRMIVFETLGTGFETPVRYPELEPYFSFLEARGFAGRAIRTDYRFENEEEARRLVSFFFDDVMLPRLSIDGLSLPECTGVWVSQKS